MTLRRAAFLAVATIFIVASCGFEIEDLQYTVDVGNYTDDSIANSLNVSVLMADGTHSFHLSRGGEEVVTGYLGGHYTVVVHPDSSTSIALIQLNRELTEKKLATATSANEIADLVAQINHLTELIQSAYQDPNGQAECTSTFTESREAIVQVSLITESQPAVSCGG